MEVRDGTVYENVIVVNSDDIEVYGVASWKPEVEVDKTRKKAMSMSIPLCIGGLYFVVSGVITVKRNKKK